MQISKNNAQCGWAPPSNLFVPVISYLSSYYSPAASNSIVVIFGSNFYSYSTVKFSTYSPTVYFINSNQIEFYVPPSLTSGTYSVQVFNGSIASNVVNYTIDNASGFWILDSDGTISNSNSISGTGGGLTINGLVSQNLGTNSFNTAFGTGALKNNTISINNTALGYNALLTTTLSNNNTAIGYEALKNNNGTGTTYSFNNTAVGYQSLFLNTTGDNNTAIGVLSGVNYNGTTTPTQGEKSGYNNTYVGFNTYPDAVYNNSTALGAYAVITASNQIMLGTAAQSVNVPGGILTPVGILPGATGVTTISSNYSGGFIEITGGTSFTLFKPDTFNGSAKPSITIWNNTTSSITVSISSGTGTFVGPSGSGTSTQTINSNISFKMYSNGTDWVVI